MSTPSAHDRKASWSRREIELNAQADLLSDLTGILEEIKASVERASGVPANAWRFAPVDASQRGFWACVEGLKQLGVELETRATLMKREFTDAGEARGRASPASD